MTITLIISILTIALLVLMIIFKPTISIKGKEIQTFWIVPVLGVILLFIFGMINISEIKEMLFKDTAINPIKILVLFLSISFLSIVLDELGFFKRCAEFATKFTKGSQYKLFLSISIVVSILTIFTSNDIVILTFTPFICYFSKHAKISPLPYLIGEFIFANTWSMMLVIGNPTNIYLSESFGIVFFKYFRTMFIPTMITGLSAFGLLILMFKKELSKKIIEYEVEHTILKSKTLSVLGLEHLILCTMLLAVSSYIGLEMWKITAAFALSMIVILFIYYIRNKNKVLFRSLKRISWNLVPFILSMFIIVGTLAKYNIIEIISKFLDKGTTSSLSTIVTYGFTSFLSCNILNNIPMSVMFERIITFSNQSYLLESIYSVIIASNIGAYLTPIGALAGIMWMSILGKSGVKFTFKDFVLKGIIVSPILLLIALFCLYLVV